MTSTLPPIVQALSGAVGSASASSLTYPLDLILTRLQLDSPARAKKRGGISGGFRLLMYIVYGDKKRRRNGMGWKALYDGLGADLFATVLSNFFYFYFYSFLRSLSMRGLQSLPLLWNARTGGAGKKIVHKPGVLEDIFLGYIAGVASRAVSSPFTIITLRLQAERADAEDEDALSDDSVSESGSNGRRSPVDTEEDSGPIGVAKRIYQQEGWQGFWRGFGTAALLSINPSITLAFFQLFRSVLLRTRVKEAAIAGKKTALSLDLKPWEAFFVGATATSIASTILYPLILAKKRLQVATGKSSATLFSVLVDAYSGKSAHGEDSLSALPKGREKRLESEPMARVAGVYQGLQMQLLKGFLNQGVTFLVKGRIEQLVVAAYLRQRRLRPRSTN